MSEIDNLGPVVFVRTYSRQKENGFKESWNETIERVISGNSAVIEVSEKEKKRLRYFMLNKKGLPAGRGLWYSGSPSHKKLGGAALNNCWFLLLGNWRNYVLAADLLMLGGGVGGSVEKEYISHLPKIKKGVVILNKDTNDADFIVPDSREGWLRLLEMTLEAFFVTGKGFSYSTVCVRPKGSAIKGFGGTASGPGPLIDCISSICSILTAKEGKKLGPVDAADLLCIIGKMVVSGNVRRSAIIILGDYWDKDYLSCKRLSRGYPSYRSMANWSVVCDDVDDLPRAFWETYSDGEAFGIVNRTNIQKYARLLEEREDTAIGVNPCAEACLEATLGTDTEEGGTEPCNLAELFLRNLSGIEEFEEAARLLVRYCIRVTCNKYHHESIEKIVHKNRRIGISISGCLGSKLFNEKDLDHVYRAIEDESTKYCKELGIPRPIRVTLVKPSGTLSLVCNTSPGIHPYLSRYMIRRVIFADNHPLVPRLREAGHHIEPLLTVTGDIDPNGMVAEFPMRAPDGSPCADEGFDTWKQLETLLMAQRYWADQAVSVTVYYDKNKDIPKIKEWLREHLKDIKTISFLPLMEHGFAQAPFEPITKERYEEMVKRIKPVDVTNLRLDDNDTVSGTECNGGSCPIR